MQQASPTSAIPAWITAEVMAETRSVWESLYGHALSEDQVIEILLLTDSLFDCLYGSSDRLPRGP